ncbi:MAG TPA: hypothetical protein VKQ30_25890 [Ktedonobacterales bacterium]|nr:hypothetical protein [Ktedonobacterales bacterium]
MQRHYDDDFLDTVGSGVLLLLLLAVLLFAALCFVTLTNAIRIIAKVSKTSDAPLLLLGLAFLGAGIGGTVVLASALPLAVAAFATTVLLLVLDWRTEDPAVGPHAAILAPWFGKG